MKILITGTKGKLVSYFRDYLRVSKSSWNCEFVSLRDDDWKKKDLSCFDSIIHLAGIVSEKNDDYDTFYKINVELTKELFLEAKRQKVSHFIYLSSMAVYDGIGWGFGNDGIITSETVPLQNSNYGRSKYEAEKAILSVDHDMTKIAIIRAPSIIGGNIEAYFDRYIKFSRIPLVPIPWIHLEAKRSFVYVDSLIEFICNLVEKSTSGLFFPQNFPQLSTSEIMFDVCKAEGREKRISKLAGRLIPTFIQKRFFSQICYDEMLSLSGCPDNSFFFTISSHDAIARTIKGKQDT